MQQLGGPGSFTSIKIRGLRTEDTAVLLDGARFRDPAAPQGDASPYLEALMATGLERVEVLRGTGATLYGTNAGGGAINVVTNPGGGEPRGSVLAEGGGLGLFRANAQTSGGYSDRLLYSFGLSHLNVADGVDGNDSVRNTSVQGRAQLKLGPTSSLAFRFYGANAKLDLNESPEALGKLPPSGIIDAVADGNYVPSADDPDSHRDASFTSTLVSFEQRPRDDFGYTIRYHGLFTSRNFFDGPEGVSAFEPVSSTLAEFEGSIHTLTARTDFAWGRQHIQAGFELEQEAFFNRSSPDDPNANSSVDVSQTSQKSLCARSSELDGRGAFDCGRRAGAVVLAQRSRVRSVDERALCGYGGPFTGERFHRRHFGRL